MRRGGVSTVLLLPVMVSTLIEVAMDCDKGLKEWMGNDVSGAEEGLHAAGVSVGG